jgi:hypothetical protein
MIFWSVPFLSACAYNVFLVKTYQKRKKEEEQAHMDVSSTSGSVEVPRNFVNGPFIRVSKIWFLQPRGQLAQRSSHTAEP